MSKKLIQLSKLTPADLKQLALDTATPSQLDSQRLLLDEETINQMADTLTARNQDRLRNRNKSVVIPQKLKKTDGYLTAFKFPEIQAGSQDMSSMRDKLIHEARMARTGE